MPPRNNNGGNTNQQSGQQKKSFSENLADATKQAKDVSDVVTYTGKAINDVESELKRGKDVLGNIGGDVSRAIADIKRKGSAAAGSYGTSSIIGKASKNLFEFPVFMSSSVPIDFATATNSLLEQIYASYVQMAISETPIVSASDVKSGNLFQNMKSDVTKYLEYTDMFYAHDACHNVIETDHAVFEYHMITLPDELNKLIMEHLNYQPLSEFDHYFQESYADDQVEKIKKELKELEDRREHLEDNVRTNVADAKERKELSDIKTEIREVRQDLNAAMKTVREEEKKEDDYGFDDESGTTRKQRDEGKDNQRYLDDRGEKTTNAYDFDKGEYIEDEKLPGSGKFKKTQTTRKERQEIRDNAEHRMRMKVGANREQREKSKHAVDMKAKGPQILDETKIQKLNTMKPLMMSVGVKVMADDGSYVSDMIDYVIGVKTHCRVVPAEVLPDVAEYPNKGQNLLTRKAKWRAGEIKFLDYLFSRKDKKQAAYDSKDPNRKWYHRLYTLAHSKGSSKAAQRITGKRSPDGLIPNATIVMTKSDVDMIEAQTNIDLLKGSEAKRLCAEMFLMAMVVIDTDAQSIKILLPDVNNDYEVHSLASVNKQLATLDTSNAVSREVTKMMHGR